MRAGAPCQGGRDRGRHGCRRMAELKATFETLGGTADDVVLDLAQVEFMDSSGVGGIVFLYKRLKMNGHRSAWWAPAGSRSSFSPICGWPTSSRSKDREPAPGTGRPEDGSAGRRLPRARGLRGQHLPAMARRGPGRPRRTPPVHRCAHRQPLRPVGRAHLAERPLLRRRRHGGRRASPDPDPRQSEGGFPRIPKSTSPASSRSWR